ncbi:unnamed protein product [Ectocarpus sp. 4 AP-2014]
MMIDMGPFGVQPRTASPETDDPQLDDEDRNQCDWEPNGSLMFNLHQSKQPADVSHWFHVAECFIGRRSEFKEHFAGMSGTDVYVKDSDTSWNSRLSPMTRLLIAAGLSSVGVRDVHFVDGNHASFFFATPSSSKSGGGGAGEGAKALRGGSSCSEIGDSPRSGQTGVLHLDEIGYMSQFVVSTEQPLPDRLAVSAPLSPVRRWDGGGVEDVAIEERGGGVRECVKFVDTVGDWGQKRDKWFPEEEDPRELLRALDSFCPIAWLRKEEEEEEEEERQEEEGKKGVDDGDEGTGGLVSPLPAGAGGDKLRRAGGRGSRGLYATVVGGPERGLAGGGRGFGAGAKKRQPKPRKLVIYQRDRNRKLLKTEELMDELWIRLGHLGWTVKEIIHDDERHPCDLVQELAGADILLTAHGFQSMLSLFMAPGSLLFEVYPHKYYKKGYAPMAQSMGLRYAYSESPPLLPFAFWSWPSVEQCMKWYLCRRYMRSSDVVITEDSIEVLISLMLKSLRVA